MNILFVGHDASRTGAPILLLHLIQWIKENTTLNCQLLLGRDGELRSEFEKHVETTIIDPVVLRKEKPGFIRKLRGATNAQRLNERITRYNPDLIYCNTLAVSPLYEFFHVNDVPILLHVHELNLFLEGFPDRESVPILVNKADRMIVVSNAVNRFVKQTFDIPDEKIGLIHGYIPSEILSLKNRQSHENSITKDELGIPQDHQVLVCCGTLDWRKGADLAVQLLANLKRSERKNVHLVWVGGDHDDVVAKNLKFEARQAGVEKNLHLVPSTNMPLKYLSIGELFVLLSREDPYPLVVLEAAALGKPIVCFEGSGGTPELIGDDAGFTVPFLDISQLSLKICEILDSPERMNSLGKNARLKAEQHDINTIVPKIINLITGTIETYQKLKV